MSAKKHDTKEGFFLSDLKGLSGVSDFARLKAVRRVSRVVPTSFEKSFTSLLHKGEPK